MLPWKSNVIQNDWRLAERTISVKAVDVVGTRLGGERVRRRLVPAQQVVPDHRTLARWAS